MKKLIFIILIGLSISTAFAQRHRSSGNQEIKWLSLSLKGGFGGSYIFNQDVMNDENVALVLSPSYSYGGRFGITYGNYIGLNIEPLMSGFSQQYSINDQINPSYVKKQKFTSFDLFVSLRYINDYGFYIEAGPQFSTLKKATVENNVDGNFTDEQMIDYKSNFAGKFTSVAFGFGYAAINGDRLQLFAGIRANYAFGNLEDNDSFYVLRDGVYNPIGNFTAKTNPLTFKLMLELNYFFGFWGDSNCGRGRLMLFQ